jgi:Rieske Fe-S protein
MTTDGLSRRSVLRGGGVVALGGVAGYLFTRRTKAAKASAGGVANAYGAPPPDIARPLAAVADVPAGGGVVLESRKIVLTRDEAGTVRGFTATCPHQGCTVSDVQGGHIDCPCHGSRFDAATGAVVRGPATSGLRPVADVVRDAQVFPA